MLLLCVRLPTFAFHSFLAKCDPHLTEGYFRHRLPSRVPGLSSRREARISSRAEVWLQRLPELIAAGPDARAGAVALLDEYNQKVVEHLAQQTLRRSASFDRYQTQSLVFLRR